MIDPHEADREALQDDLDFWRKRLASDRREVAHAEDQARNTLWIIQETQRKAHAKGIELT